ncbi:MAG: NTP transferase domain-containing protein [Deltaproteobacteria bacterium]|nr:NTP transferase domain-containing protein [Deltaproteobacteria bacterium]
MAEPVGMVLCAGLGTRLRPLTERLPKPAVPLCGLPLVRWPLALLAAAGVRRAVVNLHHLPREMERAARTSAEALGLSLSVSEEPVLAGTGGALREARRLLRDASEILLLNGDVLFAADLASARAAHRRSGALATMLLAPMPPGTAYAAVEADDGLAVRRIAGRFGPGGQELAPWHFTGYHVLSPALLDAVPALPFDCDVNRHVYPRLMDGRIRGHVDRGYWNDLGSPAGYLRAHSDLLEGRIDGARFPGADPLAALRPSGPGLWLGEGAVVEPGAVLRAPAAVGAGTRVVAGATVGPRAFVGGDCAVGAGARVEEAVVWDGTVLPAGERLQGAVAAGPLRAR